MKAVVYTSFKGSIGIQNVADPSPQPHGVVVKVLASGLCLSDWHGWMGHDPDIVLPHVPGHELAGTIEAIGKEVRNFKLGERITVPFVCGCGSCNQCNSGNHQICDNQSQPGFTHWGSFAEYVRLDYADTNLVKIPEEIDNKTAASLGCRFITAYRAIVAQGKVKAGQYVAVHGCGGVGLSAIMIANAFGAKVIAIDIDENSLKLAKEVGAIATLNASHNTEIVKEVQSLTEGGAHISVDALGSEITCFNSISNLRKSGKHIQVGLMTGDHTHPKLPMDKVIAYELEILGSHGMQAFKYPELLKMIIDGKLNPANLIDKTIRLEEAPDTLSDMGRFKNKGIVVIDSF